jgi:hypothetical protein
MNAFRRIADFFCREPGMIGTPPSQRPMWQDPAAHARDFAKHNPAFEIVLMQSSFTSLAKATTLLTRRP